MQVISNIKINYSGTLNILTHFVDPKMSEVTKEHLFPC